MRFTLQGDTLPAPVRAAATRLWRLACSVALTAVVAGCASRPPAEAVSELAPMGTLRAAINFGNPILATRDKLTGEPRGVSVDLSRELAKRLGVPLELVTFTSAGRVVDAVRAAQVGLALVGIDPERGADMNYTAAYVVIEGAYLVRNGSPIKTNAEVDRPGVRIAAGAGSAYDLFLTRELKSASLVRAPTSPEVTDFFVSRQLDVAAGVKQQLEADASRLPGLHLLEGRFMVINQAIGIPKGRESAARYMRGFIEEMKASGFVAEALRRHGIEGATVAPPAPPAPH
jgi:polar amino acid transport system substrate-binding protein